MRIKRRAIIYIGMVGILPVFYILFLNGTDVTCPRRRMKCPTGETFTIRTCWSWTRLNCLTCMSIFREMKRNCRKFSCRGSTSEWYGRDDGCSIPIARGTVTGFFRAACAIHDICYATPGRTQSQCDSDFLHNMLMTCAFPGIGSFASHVCAGAAHVAFAAVRVIGKTFPSFAETCTEVTNRTTEVDST